MEKLKVLDVFAGIGGFSLGLERTGGFETLAFCEINNHAQSVLKKHWPTVPIYDDVRGDFKAAVENYYWDKTDVVVGGFPCQDISTAGKGAGLAGERSGLWWELREIIKETRPKYAVIENVAALRSRGLDQVLGSLSTLGYDAEWHCIPASAVGALTRGTGSGSWPTPRSCSAMAATITPESSWNPKRFPNLETVVGRRLWPTPNAGGKKWGGTMQEWGGSGNWVRSYPELARGQLNPEWVEWLMGFPAGWTDLSN